MDRKQIQRLVILIFGIAFVASTGIAVIGGLFRRRTIPTTTNLPAASETSITEQLQAQARGYAKVLEREPENVTALSGLLQTSLQAGDLETAKVPLKKLISLYPERTELTNLLAEIEAELQRNQEQIPQESE